MAADNDSGEALSTGTVVKSAAPEPEPATAPPGGGGGALFRRYRWWVALGASVILVAVLVPVLISRSPGSQPSSSSLRVAGIPANVTTGLATLMGLQPAGEKPVSAPNFTLTDQHGKTVSLSSFRGHPVVLNFFDPRCVTICPIVAQEFIQAEHELARSDPGVVFVAVNVNRHALGVATVAAFTKEHGLTAIPTWHFLTGTLPALEHIWSEYGIDVATRVVHGRMTVEHTTIDYFIGPDGKERYIAAPNADYRSTPTHRAYLPSATYAAWARGIALVVRDM